MVPLPLLQGTLVIIDTLSVGIILADGLSGGLEMGVFASFFKPVKSTAVGLPSGLSDFLNQVDSLYMEAYQLKSTKNISKYLTREAAGRLQAAVCSMNTRYFGDAKFRNTKWSKETDGGGDDIIVLKEVTFDSVHIAGSLSIAVASNYKERWTVTKQGKEYRVARIALT